MTKLPPLVTKLRLVTHLSWQLRCLCDWVASVAHFSIQEVGDGASLVIEAAQEVGIFGILNQPNDALRLMTPTRDRASDVLSRSRS